MNIKKYPYPVKVPTFSTAKDLRQLGWQSLLFYHQLRFLTKRRKSNGLWINLSSRRLQQRYGKHYTTHLDVLAKSNWIEVNSKYRNAKGGFTKSFRLSEKTFGCKHKEHLALLGKTAWLKFTRKLSADKSDLSSDYLKLIKERHDFLSIPVLPRSHKGKFLKAKLDCKIANISLGENQRVYSTIIMAERKAREGVVFGNKGRLVNVDVTAMAQQILNIGIQDSKWENWIRKDFFCCLGKALDLNIPRDYLKKLFMKAISNSTNNPQAMVISQLLRREFPQIMEKVDKLNCFSTVQMETQRQEANLIAAFIQDHKHLTMIPAHDGVFCGESEALTVQDALETFLKRKGLLGITKISPDLPHLRQKSLFEILESIPELAA